MSVLAEFERYDGIGLAELVRRREVTATEVLEETITRIEARNPTINAIVTRMYDEARKAIAAGLPTGPFTGVPYLLKDLGALYTGVITAGGSRLFATDVANHDSELTARLRLAGLVIAGKSNTPEMGLAPSTEPRLFGPTRNPWKLSHSAGGSSGGAAAAVASGMLPMAHATDGGGSIRIPASCCGLFGLKPTRGRVSMAPDAGEGWGGASVIHAVTRTVRDSAALLDATSGAAVGHQVARFMQRYDIILTPTMCAPPQQLGVLDMMTTDANRYLAAVFASIGFTSLFNSTGQPAMSVPLAWSAAGLPLGVQFVGRFAEEAALFRLAAQLEAARPWAGRRPPLDARAS